jgi:hypothetical protein
MTFIDWSDSEELFGLLIEYVQDEKAESNSDLDRRKFLSDLINDLMELKTQFSALSSSDVVSELRNIAESVDSEFKSDPVVTHIQDCIVELQRLNSRG